MCHFCISALSLWIEKLAGSHTSTLASSCPSGSMFPSPAVPEPSVYPRATRSLTSPKSSPQGLPQDTLSSSLRRFPPKKVHLLPLVSVTFFFLLTDILYEFHSISLSCCPVPQAAVWILLSPPSCSNEKRNFLSHSGEWDNHFSPRCALRPQLPSHQLTQVAEPILFS